LIPLLIASFLRQVSMQHSEAVPANTEFEYLRNIMFQVSVRFLNVWLRFWFVICRRKFG